MPCWWAPAEGAFGCGVRQRLEPQSPHELCSDQSGAFTAGQGLGPNMPVSFWVPMA